MIDPGADCSETAAARRRTPARSRLAHLAARVRPAAGLGVAILLLEVVIVAALGVTSLGLAARWRELLPLLP